MLKLSWGRLATLGLIGASCVGLMACSESSSGSKETAQASDSAAEKKVLNFGIISTESSQNLKTEWQPLLDDMSKSIGMEVKPFFASDYAGVIQGMRFGNVDMAWYGNKSAMEAVDRAEGEVFAQVVYADGTTGYKSLLITQKDSPLKNEKDMLAKAADLTFANGDPNSTSGYLVPGYYVFAQNNVEPTAIFKRTLNASHESNLMAVANKQVDVGTFNSNTWEMLSSKQPQVIEKVKVIWESPEIPSDPLVWRKDMPDDLKNKVKTFLLSYGSTPEEKEVLKKLTWSKFQESSNAQLQPTRDLEAFKVKLEQEKQAKGNG